MAERRQNVRGRPRRENPLSGLLSVRLSPTEYDRLYRAYTEQDPGFVNLSEYVRHLLRESLRDSSTRPPTMTHDDL
jgi:hypothetical protein